jgi:hypothetical protein
VPAHRRVANLFREPVEERWRDLSDGEHVVSERGRVARLPNVDRSHRYPRVSIGGEKRYVHHLVAEAFHGPARTGSIRSAGSTIEAGTFSRAGRGAATTNGATSYVWTPVESKNGDALTGETTNNGPAYHEAGHAVAAVMRGGNIFQHHN